VSRAAKGQDGSHVNIDIMFMRLLHKSLESIDQLLGDEWGMASPDIIDTGKNNEVTDPVLLQHIALESPIYCRPQSARQDGIAANAMVQHTDMGRGLIRL